MWFTQIINQVYINKILLSFLIAIIGKSFKAQTDAANKNGYEARAALNAKCSVVMNFFGLLSDETDLVVLSANYRKPEVPSADSKMKDTITACNKEVDRIGQEIQNFTKSQAQMAKSHKQDMEELKTLMKQLIAAK